MTSKPPIFLVSRFRSGSSFLWNLFRQDERYRCFYEPFHDNLTESLESAVAPQVSHRGIDSYWNEYQAGRGRILGLHRPQFGFGDLFLHPRDPYPELAGFIQQLIRTAAQDGRTCVIKCNRLDFRLAWLRRNFPQARIIHMVRNSRDQWISSVQPHKMEYWDRLEENRGYDLPLWIASLAPSWPFLLRASPQPAYYYSYLLWKLSGLFGRRFAQYNLDFDRDVAESPPRLQQTLASFFPDGFFQRPKIMSLLDPPHPGGWRRFRTEEWFADLEARAEATLTQAGIYKPAFWKWENETKPRPRPSDENRRAIDLALLTFSRHRGELLLHSQQLRESLETAKKYAETLNLKYTEAAQTLQTTEGVKHEAEYKLRLLQAVYDSLKQVHELSLNSLNKTLEEFQFTTRELRQLITYKDEQIQQLARALPPAPAALQLPNPLPAPADASPGTGDPAQAARDQATIGQLKAELAAAQTASLSARTLQKHLVALENSAADLWSELTRARHEVAELGTIRGQLENNLSSGQLAQTKAQHEIQRLTGQVSAKLERISLLEQDLVDRQSKLEQARQVEHKLRQEIATLDDEMERSRASTRSELARDQATIDQLREELAHAQSQAQQEIHRLTEQVSAKLERISLLDQDLVDRQSKLEQARQVEHMLRQDIATLGDEMERSRASTRSELARDQATIDLLREELALAQTAALTASALQKHVVALEQSSVDTWTALTQARHQLDELGVALTQARQQIDEDGRAYRELEAARLQAEERNQDVTRQLAEESRKFAAAERTITEVRLELAEAGQLNRDLAAQLADEARKSAEAERVLGEMRRELSEIHQRSMKEGQLISSLETQLQAAQAKARQAEQLQARLNEELAAEQTGRAAEKHAYDERAAIFTAQAGAARAMQEEELTTLRHQLADARRDLAVATARLNALNESWTAGVVRRLVPGAFTSKRT